MKWGIKYYVNDKPVDWCGEITSNGKILDVYGSLNEAFKRKEISWRDDINGGNSYYKVEEYKE